MNRESAFWPYLVDALKSKDIYLTVLVVGTLINLYGQVIVPALHGVDAPLSALGDQFGEHPGLVVLSVGLGYVFPFGVAAVSTALTRYRGRRQESLAQFPDTKPDPVFRVSYDGAILEVGDPTQAMFERHGILHAQDILGKAVWDKIAGCPECGSGSSPDVKIHFRPEGLSYLVVWSKVPSGVNIYLTRTNDPSALEQVTGA